MKILVQNKKDEKNLYKFLRKQGLCFVDGSDLFTDMPLTCEDEYWYMTIITIDKTVYLDSLQSTYINKKEMINDKDLVIWKDIRKSKKIIKNRGFFYVLTETNIEWIPKEFSEYKYCIFINGRLIKGVDEIPDEDVFELLSFINVRLSHCI